MSRRSMRSGLTRGWNPVRGQGHAPNVESTAFPVDMGSPSDPVSTENAVDFQKRENAPMDIATLGPGFAAELRGVTLAEVAAEDAAYAAVRAAFEEHSVLVFRGQQVTDEIQLAFSRRFGPPEVTKVGSLGTGTHFVTLSTIGADGKVVPPDHRLALRNKANQLWHTDSSFKSVPALASVLSARIIPERGGETEFVSTRLAFDRLDAALRERVRNSF